MFCELVSDNIGLECKETVRACIISVAVPVVSGGECNLQWGKFSPSSVVSQGTSELHDMVMQTDHVDWKL